MPLQPLTICALVAALLPATEAQAQALATASASIDNFSYELIDLTPNDGIAPSATFTDGQRRAEALLYDEPVHVPVATARSLDYGSAKVENADGMAESFLAPRQARAAVGAGNYSSSQAFAFDTIDFVLSPHARLIFSGDARVDVQQNLQSNVFANAKISGEIPSSPILSTRSPFSSSLESALGSNQRTLSVVVNSADDETIGFVELRAQAEAISRIPPVPQPPQVLMALGGLGLLAASRMRRRCGTPRSTLPRRLRS
jgi:hypothetical protein